MWWKIWNFTDIIVFLQKFLISFQLLPIKITFPFIVIGPIFWHQSQVGSDTVILIMFHFIKRWDKPLNMSTFYVTYSLRSCKHFWLNLPVTELVTCLLVPVYVQCFARLGTIRVLLIELVCCCEAKHNPCLG